MPRKVQPELLDSLAPQHPDAMHMRRDLLLLHTIMGNHRWIVRAAPAQVRPGESLLELGAGDGSLAARLAALDLSVDALDRVPAPESWPTGSRWHQTDLFSFSHFGDYPVVIGNHIFHHFSDSQLRELGAMLLPHTRLIIASEPARRRRFQLLFRTFASVLGANRITLHDAHVSIDAGFADQELPTLLGCIGPDWDVRCHQTLLGAYRMIASRRG